MIGKFEIKTKVQRWHRLIEQPETDYASAVRLCKEEYGELLEAGITKPQRMKERADEAVVLIGALMRVPEDDEWLSRILRIKLDSLELMSTVDLWQTVDIVNDSNMTKLFSADMIEKVQEYFDSEGVAIEIREIERDVFGAYDSNNKLRKHPWYTPVDTSIEWWK